MLLLSLPQEILVLIARQLRTIDFIPCLQVNRMLYRLLIYELCKRDVSDNGGLAMSFYAFWGYETRVLDMIAAGATIDLPHPRWRDRTPLMLAISRHHVSIARVLLDHGANPNFIGDVKNSPLEIAILNASGTDFTMIALLLDYGANINQRGYQGRTPLYTAILRQDPAKVAFLLSQGADVSVRESKKARTPLLFARGERSSHENDEIVKMLLDAGSEEA